MRLQAITLVLLLLPAPGAAAGTLTVAVASSMMPVMEELRPEFRALTGAELTLVSGSSGKFAAQIRTRGAPFDAFISADTEYPDALAADGFADGGPLLYAYGHLVLWTLRDLDPARGLSLAEGARRVAVADPKVAPYGRAAVAALKAAGLIEKAGPKLVYGESISQTNQFIMTKAADFGITAKSTVLAPKTRGLGRWADVDPALYERIPQSLIVLKKGAGEDPRLRRRFKSFMAGPQARAALGRFGYSLPAP